MSKFIAEKQEKFDGGQKIIKHLSDDLQKEFPTIQNPHNL